MLLPRLTKLALAVSLVAAAVPAAVVTTAAAAPGTQPSTQPSIQPSARPEVPPSSDGRAADDALEAVAEAFEQGPGDVPGAGSGADAEGRDLTLLLVDLAQGLDDLSPAERDVARGYLARPTDGGADQYGDGYQADAVVRTTCSADVCVTWDDNPGNGDAPAGAGGSEVPAQVDKTQGALLQVWDRIITQGGYRAPLPDTGRAGGAGPTTQFDVYLADIGGAGLYGYCAPDSNRRTSPAYCVLDEDFAEFPNHTPQENLEVTTAHEFFHAVQFAYDVYEEWWFLEGTAAWMEDEIYDSVNDNRYYLRFSQLRQPSSPLDRSGGLWVYGSWIWWRFLTEDPRLSEEAGTGLPVFVRRLWERAGQGDASTQGLQALRDELSSRGLAFEPLFADFAVANRQPATSYEEGAAYRRAPLETTHNLSGTRRTTGWQSLTLKHLSSGTVAIRPSSSYQEPGWRLRLVVDLPARSKDPLATAKVFRTDGSTRTTRVDLAGDGTGSVRLPFSSSAVDRVELSLTNAGLENRQPFRYKAAASR